MLPPEPSLPPISRINYPRSEGSKVTVDQRNLPLDYRYLARSGQYPASELLRLACSLPF